MNIMSVSGFDAAVQQLGSIKGNVTSEQLSGLTELFSSGIWNTSDAEGTSANIDRQIQQLQALLDEIQAEIDDLYNQQKYANDEMNQLINDLDEESYQASKQQDKNIKEQQDLVSAATDEAFNAYMRGDIEKEEIPSFIAAKVGKSNSSGGTAMQGHLDAMDAKGQKITSLSNKIAGMLDSINEYKAKYQTSEASLELLKKLKTKIPTKKTRGDIETDIARPYFSPSQEALGDKLIDAFKVQGEGDKNSKNNPATVKLNEALTNANVTVDETRKAQLDAMSPEEKAAAVEACDTNKYTALELMYLSGMDMYQAASAIGTVFSEANVKYNTSNGSLSVPYGHDGAKDIYNELISQYKTLWNGNAEEGSDDTTETPASKRTDPIGWRDGDTNYMFAIDRNGDNIFDGANEFLGAENGWAEVTALDANGDGTLTAEEAAAGNVFVVDVNQALKDGGLYGFNGAAEAGFQSLDLSSYKEIDDLKNININGNKRTAEFNMKVNGQTVIGKQTENTQEYNETFYGHMAGEALSFGLDPDEVAQALQEAAQPVDVTSRERAEAEAGVTKAETIIEEDEISVEQKEEELAEITEEATDVGYIADRPEESEETETAEETDEVADTEETAEVSETAEEEPVSTSDEAEASEIPQAVTDEEIVDQNNKKKEEETE